MENKETPQGVADMDVNCNSYYQIRKGVSQMTTTRISPMKLKLQHHLNSLHVYSYLCKLKVNRERALLIVKVLELYVHPLLYAKGGAGVSVVE